MYTGVDCLLLLPLKGVEGFEFLKVRSAVSATETTTGYNAEVDNDSSNYFTSQPEPAVEIRGSAWKYLSPQLWEAHKSGQLLEVTVPLIRSRLTGVNSEHDHRNP